MKDYRQQFRKSVSRHFPFQSSAYMTHIDEEFKLVRRNVEFARSSRNPLDARLEIAAYFLSTIIVLDQHGHSYEKIREIVLDVARNYVRPKNKIQMWFKKLPAIILSRPYMTWFLDIFDRRASIKGNEAGFVAHVIHKKNSDTDFVFGFDIIECGICKLFNRYNYSRFTSILCEVDYITSDLAGLKLTRTDTIANGAHKCDFRFEKK